MSKEHALSASVAAAIDPSTKGITVTIDDSSGSTKVTVGVNSLSLPILCSHHNNLLGPTDAEAACFFGGLARLASRRLPETGLLNESGQAVLKIDGHLFERWAAKTFYNLVVAAIPFSHKKSPLLSLTGSQIVEEVFNGRPFARRHGLHLLPLNINLMHASLPDFYQGTPTFKILSMDVNHYSHSIRQWAGPYRLLTFLYIRAYGIEFLMHANLTTIGNDDWDQLVAPHWSDPAAQAATRHPSRIGFDLPKLDGLPSNRRRRLILFSW